MNCCIYVILSFRTYNRFLLTCTLDAKVWKIRVSVSDIDRRRLVRRRMQLLSSTLYQIINVKRNGRRGSESFLSMNRRWRWRQWGEGRRTVVRILVVLRGSIYGRWFEAIEIIDEDSYYDDLVCLSFAPTLWWTDSNSWKHINMCL